MVDVIAGLQGLNGLLSAAKALKDMNSESIRVQASIDIQRQLLAAIQDYQALSEANRALEAECVRLKDWSNERKNYQLEEIGDQGVLAYVFQEPDDDPAPAHTLCPSCFADTQKSILQTVLRQPGRTKVLFCHRCALELYVEGHWQPEHAAGTGGRKR